MKNLSGLPDRWAVNIEEEAGHHRMGEFKEWIKEMSGFGVICDWNYFGNFSPVYRCDTLPEGVTLITLDQFFEMLEASKELNTARELVAKGTGHVHLNPANTAVFNIPEELKNTINFSQPSDSVWKKDWQPKRGEMVEVSGNGEDWHKREYVGKFEGWDFHYCIERSTGVCPHYWKYIRPLEQPTTLRIEDAKKAYAKALNLEGKKIDWV